MAKNTNNLLWYRDKDRQRPAARSTAQTLLSTERGAGCPSSPCARLPIRPIRQGGRLWLDGGNSGVSARPVFRLNGGPRSNIKRGFLVSDLHRYHKRRDRYGNALSAYGGAQ